MDGDKFHRFLQFVGIAIVMWGVANSAHAQDKKTVEYWDFSGPRLPNFEQLHKNFPRLEVSGRNKCDNRVQTYWDRYVKLHPGAASFGNDPTVRDRWRRALLLNNPMENQWDEFCFHSGFLREIRAERPRQLKHISVFGFRVWQEKPYVRYCGGEVKPSDKRLQQLHKLLDEQLSHSMTGKFLAISAIHYDHQLGKIVNLNPDLLLYLGLVARKLAKIRPGLAEAVVDIASEVTRSDISPERRAFVEAAFERDDYQAVLDTTAKCGKAE